MVECLFCVHLHLSNPKLTPLGVRHPTKQYRMFTPSFLYFFLDADVTPEDPHLVDCSVVVMLIYFGTCISELWNYIFVLRLYFE